MHVRILLTLLLVGAFSLSSSDPENKRSITRLEVVAEETAPSQQLHLMGVSSKNRNVIGFQVFLNPPNLEKLSVQHRSYQGAVYFSHRRPGITSDEDFVVTLKEIVKGKASIILLPIGAARNEMPKAKTVIPPITVRQSSIRPVDNSAFK